MNPIWLYAIAVYGTLIAGAILVFHLIRRERRPFLKLRNRAR
jgi:hypothetical protein